MGKGNMQAQFLAMLDTATIPISPEIAVRSDLAVDEATTFPWTKRETSQIFFTRQVDHMTERIQNFIGRLVRKWVWSSLILLLPILAAQSMIYVMIQSRTAMKTTDIEFPIGHTRSYVTSMYTLWSTWESATKQQWINYRRILKSSHIKHGTDTHLWLLLSSMLSWPQQLKCSPPKTSTNTSQYALRSIAGTLRATSLFLIPDTIRSIFKFWVVFSRWTLHDDTFFTHSPDVQKAATAIKFRLKLATNTNFIKIYKIRNAIYVPLETLGHCTNLGRSFWLPTQRNTSREQPPTTDKEVKDSHQNNFSSPKCDWLNYASSFHSRN